MLARKEIPDVRKNGCAKSEKKSDPSELSTMVDILNSHITQFISILKS